jgi:hypothetical protein
MPKLRAANRMQRYTLEIEMNTVETHFWRWPMSMLGNLKSVTMIEQMQPEQNSTQH